MTENNDKFTQMEYRVIDELKEVYDPIIMTEEEIHTKNTKIRCQRKVWSYSW